LPSEPTRNALTLAAASKNVRTKMERFIILVWSCVLLRNLDKKEKESKADQEEV
jgi:hypothetical protein